MSALDKHFLAFPLTESRRAVECGCIKHVGVAGIAFKLHGQGGRRNCGKIKGTNSAAILVDKHMLTYKGTPGTTCGDNSDQDNSVLTLKRLLNSEGEFYHARLTREQSIVPGLDKYIENAAAIALALHGYLFG